MKGGSTGAKRATKKRVRRTDADHLANGQEAAEPAVVEPVGPVLRPGQCRRYMRQRLAAEFPGIVQGFVEGARAGSCAHVKLVTELLGEPEPTRSRKGSAVRLLEQLGRA